MNIEVEVELDDQLVARAMEYTGINDLNELARRALEELLEREERRRANPSTTQLR